MSYSLKRLLVGKAKKTAQALHERLTKKTGLAVFASDALSSTAYASEEILLVLAVTYAWGQANAFNYVVISLRWDDERLVICAVEDGGFFESAAFLAPQYLKQPGHGLLVARVGTGKDVAETVAVEIHKLWSRAGASPDARHLGHFSVGVQPFASGESASAQPLEDSNLSFVELPDEQVFLPVAVDVREAWRGPTRVFDAHKGVAALEAGG